MPQSRAALASFGVDYPNGGHDKEAADSFPASDPPSDAAPGHEPHREDADAPAHQVAVAEAPPKDSAVTVTGEDGQTFELDHGAVVTLRSRAARTRRTLRVMIAAGLVAKKAVERGLERKPWVKSSLAPGSKVVTEYYERPAWTVTSTSSASRRWGTVHDVHREPGPLPDEISRAVTESDLAVASVLSGNRNFEARIHPEVKANYLASPPLVVAYALAGRIDVT